MISFILDMTTIRVQYKAAKNFSLLSNKYVTLVIPIKCAINQNHSFHFSRMNSHLLYLVHLIA